MKAVIFDSGTLITLSMNGLLDMLRDLRKIFNGRFIITKEVENEIVTRPMNIKKFKLGAIRLKSLIGDGVLEFPVAFNINQNDISRISKDILKSANSIYFAEGKPVHIIDEGEASILALGKLLRDKGIENMIAMDERTTRILCEKPDNLKNLLERKLHTKITEKGVKGWEFHKCNFIRSTELIFIAYKRGLIPKNKELLDAMLYGAKFKGAAISGDEIKIMKGL